MAMAELNWGVRNISKERSGRPRWSCSGKGAIRRKASAVNIASRYVGWSSLTLNTLTSEARMKAPATSPVMYGYTTIKIDQWISISLG